MGTPVFSIALWCKAVNEILLWRLSPETGGSSLAEVGQPSATVGNGMATVWQQAGTGHIPTTYRPDTGQKLAQYLPNISQIPAKYQTDTGRILRFHRSDSMNADGAVAVQKKGRP